MFDLILILIYIINIMKHKTHKLIFFFSLVVLLISSSLVFADENEILRQRIKELEQELFETREKLAESEFKEEKAVQSVTGVALKESPIKLSSSLRANYIYGDYDNRRGEGIGDVDLELFFLSATLDYNNFIGKVQYRWYDGYSMMHTAWLGYDSDNFGTFKAGIVRAPFGPGPFGASTSWFFDQHFYVGLADDMDLGVRWTKPIGNLTIDLAYYIEDEGHWDGDSLDSARYNYDVVRRKREGGGSEGFEEQHQFNLRAIYALEGIGDLGASFQYGNLKGTNVDDEGAKHYAVSGHAKNSLGDFTLVSQISYYKYDITNDTPWNTGDLILMGAYDYTTLVASEAWIPSLSLRWKGINTSSLDWIDSVTPYAEWSSIRKMRDNFNNSSLYTIGAVWSWGDLYIYTDMAFSDGNDFVGPKGDYGENINNKWQKRFNVNIGYYFDIYK